MKTLFKKKEKVWKKSKGYEKCCRENSLVERFGFLLWLWIGVSTAVLYAEENRISHVLTYPLFLFHVIYILMSATVFQRHLGSDYDLERIIDDWILMGFLVGNDFIPHLPHLHINHDALPLLYKTYMSVLPSLGGEAPTHTHNCIHTYFSACARVSPADKRIFQMCVFLISVYSAHTDHTIQRLFLSHASWT